MVTTGQTQLALSQLLPQSISESEAFLSSLQQDISVDESLQHAMSACIGDANVCVGPKRKLNTKSNNM